MICLWHDYDVTKIRLGGLSGIVSPIHSPVYLGPILGINFYATFIVLLFI